jgi:hypothetical protein
MRYVGLCACNIKLSFVLCRYRLPRASPTSSVLFQAQPVQFVGLGGWLLLGFLYRVVL